MFQLALESDRKILNFTWNNKYARKAKDILINDNGDGLIVSVVKMYHKATGIEAVAQV